MQVNQTKTVTTYIRSSCDHLLEVLDIKYGM
jgi:hypothetical protein